MSTEAEIIPTNDTTPISASEAARELSNYRWQKDGHDEKPAPLSYTEMTPASPVKPPPEGDMFDSPREAADALIKEREQTQGEREIIPLEYKYQGGDKAGEKMPDNLSVSLEQSAADVAAYRESLLQNAEAAEEVEVQKAIDALRAGDQQQAQPEAVDHAPQAQQEQPQATADDEVVRALQNPKVLNAVNDYVAQASAQHGAAAEQYIRGLAQNAQVAAAAVYSNFPELQGASAEAIPQIIRAVSGSNPQRAQQMAQMINQTRELVAQAQHGQAAYAQAVQQQQRAQFNQWSQSQDGDYEAWVSKEVSATERRAIEAEALAMVREAGSDAEVMAAWQSNTAFRSAWAQRALFDAARWRLAQKSLDAKRVRPNIPTVQRPGVSGERVPARDAELKVMNDRLNRTHNIKDAAALVAARRQARR